MHKCRHMNLPLLLLLLNNLRATYIACFTRQNRYNINTEVMATKPVAMAAMVALVVVLVAGNYSIVSGGEKAAVSQMSGDGSGAKERGHQAAKEVVGEESNMVGHVSSVMEGATEAGRKAEDLAETWTEWAKEQIQEGLGLKHNPAQGDGGVGVKEKAKHAAHYAGDAVMSGRDKIQEVVSGAGQYTADKAGEAKEKAYQTACESCHKASDMARETKERSYETANQATDKARKLKGNAQQEVQDTSEKAADIKDKAQERVKESLKQSNDAKHTLARKVEEAKDKTVQKAEEAQDKATQAAEEGYRKRDEAGESLNWAKEKAQEGYNAAKEKVRDTLHTAKEKVARTARGDEL